MKNNKLIHAVIPGALIALAALMLSLRHLVSVDSIVGYGCVIALLGVAALEYRISWRRLFGR